MDNKLIGASIASLRQKRGWTQRQLARQLNVSHQAVSKWENGDAAPDVETLVALARLFGVTIDRVINPKPADLRTSGSLFSRRKVDDFDEEEEDDGDDEDMPDVEDDDDDDDGDFDNDDDDDDGDFDDDDDDDDDDDFDGDDDDDDDEEPKSKLDPKLELLKKIAPFVSREVLDEKFLTYLEKNDLQNFGVIEQLAPFVSREVLGRAIDKVIDKQINPQVVLRLSPFFAKKDLARLLMTIEDREWVNQNLPRLAPFLPREYLDKLLMDLEF